MLVDTPAMKLRDKCAKEDLQMAKWMMTVMSVLALSCLGAEKNTIPVGSKIYVDSNNGFDIFILAAFQAKHVGARLVSSADKADYILDSSLFHSHEAATTEKVAGTYRISEAAFKLTSKSEEIVWQQPKACSAAANNRLRKRAPST